MTLCELCRYVHVYMCIHECIHIARTCKCACIYCMYTWNNIQLASIGLYASLLPLTVYCIVSQAVLRCPASDLGQSRPRATAWSWAGRSRRRAGRCTRVLSWTAPWGAWCPAGPTASGSRLETRPGWDTYFMLAARRLQINWDNLRWFLKLCTDVCPWHKFW